MTDTEVGSAESADRPLVRTAYYTDGIAWGSFNWPKTMLLFFDRVAVLVPEAEQDAFERSDEAVIAGLREHDVLEVLRPSALVDSDASSRIIAELADRVQSMPSEREPGADMLIYLEKLGNGVQVEQVKEVVAQLERTAHAKPFVYGQSMIIRPSLGYLILDAIAREAARTGRKLGLDLHPSRCVGTQRELLPRNARAEMWPGATVVESDVEEVGVDLGPVPVDEILDFKRQHASLLDRYRVGLREFCDRLAQAPSGDRGVLLAERREEIQATKRDLQSAYREWRSLAAIGIGLSGVVWTACIGEIVGAGLSAAGLAIDRLTSHPASENRLTYLVQAGQRF